MNETLLFNEFQIELVGTEGIIVTRGILKIRYIKRRRASRRATSRNRRKSARTFIPASYLRGRRARLGGTLTFVITLSRLTKATPGTRL